MRLSTVFELLLIFLLIAFAAYARVIENNEVVLHRTVRSANVSKQSNVGVTTISLKQATDNVNKYCTCNENVCNCCRDFNIPVVQLKGPGCASLQYLQGDDLAVQLSFGDNILTNTVVSGKNPKPVCVPLPGGFSKFCGRIYAIKREANRHFKACLGLELQSSSDVEASLRVSCFRFGPDGLKLRPPEPLPIVESDSSSNDDDDDDDDDIFGLGSDADDDEEDDDDDDDEDDEPAEANSVPASSTSDDNDSSDDDDDDDEDLLGLGALFDIFSGADDDTTNKPKVTTPVPQFTIPLLTKPISEEPLGETEDLTLENDLPIASSPAEPEKIDVTTEAAIDDSEAVDTTLSETATLSDSSSDGSDAIQAVASNNVEEVVELDGSSSNDVNKVVTWNKNKPYITSAGVNAIQNDIKKPLIRPGKPDPVETVVSTINNVSNDDNDDDDNEDDDDDDDILGAADLDDDEDDEENDEEKEEDDNEDEEEEDEKEDEDEDESDEDEKIDNDKKKKPSNANKNSENKKNGTVVSEVDGDDDDVDADDDDDDDEEEDAVLSALVEDDDKEQTKDDKISNNETGNQEEDDADYGFNLAELLARKRRARRGRQSKVMRL